MKAKLKNFKVSEESNEVKKLVLFSFLVTIVLCVKYILGNIPGVELVTFLLCLYAFYFSLKDSLFIVMLFIFAVSLLSGFNYSILMYWIIFPCNILIVHAFRKKINNAYSFAIVTGTLAFLLTGWYFLSDLLLFGAILAVSKLITALPIAFISFVVNFIVALWLFKPLNKLFNANMHFIVDDHDPIFIKESFTVTSALLSTITSSVLIIGVIFFTINNTLFIQIAKNVKDVLSNNQTLNNKYDYVDKQGLLTSDEYFKFYNSLAINQCGIVAIHDENTIFKARINNCDNKILQDIIFDRTTMKEPEKFYFTEVISKSNISWGKFVGDLWGFKDGKWQQINANGVSPTIFNRDAISVNGATNSKLQNGEIYQISYSYEKKFLKVGDSLNEF